MTGIELQEKLHELGWSQAELSRKLDVSGNTVSRWATGKVPVSGCAVKYVELCLEFRRTMAQLNEMNERGG